MDRGEHVRGYRWSWEMEVTGGGLCGLSFSHTHVSIPGKMKNVNRGDVGMPQSCRDMVPEALV